MLQELLRTFLSQLEQPVDQNGMGFTMILGRPETGRVEYAYPLGSLIVTKSAQALLPKPAKRIGDTHTIGRSVVCELYLYATDEAELCNQIDTLHILKGIFTGLESGGDKYTIRYDDTNRIPPDPDDPYTYNVTVTAVTFTNFSAS